MPRLRQVHGGLPGAVQHHSGEQRALEAKQPVRLTPPRHPVRDGKTTLGSKPDADQALGGTQNAGSRLGEAGSKQAPDPGEEVARDVHLELDAVVGTDGEGAENGLAVARAPEEGDVATAALAFQASQDPRGTVRPRVAPEAREEIGQVRAPTRDDVAAGPPPLPPLGAEISDPGRQRCALETLQPGEQALEGGGPCHQPGPRGPGGLRGPGFTAGGGQEGREQRDRYPAGRDQRASK